MTYPRLRTLARGLALASILAPAAAFADDTNISGNLDVEGNSLTLGTASTAGPGLSLLYVDGTTSTIYLNATQASANWIWQVNSGTPQMQLTGANQLLIYDQSATPVAAITLDPQGVSTFANSLVANGSDNRLPNQTITGSGSILTAGSGDGRYLSQGALGSGNTWTGTQTFAAGANVSSGSLTVASGTISSASGTPLVFQSGSTPVMTLGAAGNVGVGTTSPAYRMDVASTANDAARFSSTGGWLGLLLTSGNGQTWAFVSGVNGTTSDFGIEDRTAGRSGTKAPFVIRHSDASVGIGTSSPRGSVEIQRTGVGVLGPTLALTNYSGGSGAGASVDYYTYNAESIPGVRMEAIDANNYSADWVLFTRQVGQTGNTLVERMRVTSTGTVNIGTAATPANLAVTGNSTLAGVVTVKTKLRVAQSGDLPMGEFTSDGGLGNPAQ